MSTLQSSLPKILVWDAPVRVFHWMMVLSFAGAYMTAESERWRLVHVSLGYTVGGLVIFRIVWGLFGTRYARFASFVRGPTRVMDYLRAMVAGQAPHHVGHNPAGAVAILLLIVLSVIAVGTGWAIYNDVGASVLEEVHEFAGNFMLLVVLVHVLGVFLASWLHRENLVRSMITGKKAGQAKDAIGRPWRAVAVIMLVAVLSFWYWQWQSAPAPGASPAPATAARDAHQSHHDKHQR